MSPSSQHSRFLAACAGQIPEVTPVWLMRQAGRILPEYRQLRAQHGSIQTLFSTPELAARITLMPVEQLGVDAAILFTDLVTPLQAMGREFEYAPGPVFAAPVRCRTDVDSLRLVEPDRDLGFVLDTVRLVRQALAPDKALIGYAGSPFTLATWLVEGRSSKDFPAFRRMLYHDPTLARALLARLGDVCIAFLRAQVEAGAQAVQLFDTSVGLLTPDLFGAFVHPELQRVFAALDDLAVPRIYLPLAAPHLLDRIRGCGAEVLSLDWRCDMGQARSLYGDEYVLQGNLDPCALYGSPDTVRAEAEAILARMAGAPHIFNLGHGVLPDTPLDHVRHLVDVVHAYRSPAGT